jgi:integrase
MKINLINYNGTPRHQLVGRIHGKLIRRWFDSETEAQKFWDKSVREAARGASVIVNVPDAERTLALACIERARAGGYDILTALGHYESYLLTKVSQNLTVTDAVTKLVRERELLGRRPRSVKSLRNLLEAFAKVHGSKNCDEVTPDDIRSFVSQPKWSHQTRNGYLTRLHALFSWCVSNGSARINPVAKVDRFSVTSRTPEVLSVEDAAKLLETCKTTDVGLLPYFALGLFCGIRPNELERLSRKSILTDESLVEVGAAQSKIRRRRLVTLPECAKSWLAVDGGTVGEWSNIRKRVDAVWAASGVKRSADVLRHSFASYHLALHKDAPKTSHELGHSGDTDMLFEHYRNVVKPADAALFFNIQPK